MMNELFSWLQSAVNIDDLNDYLYWLELKSYKKSENYLDKIYLTIQEMAREFSWNQTIKDNNLSVNVVDLPNKKIHAQYDPNTQTITINTYWLTRYEKIMSQKQAKYIHLGHELYHVVEEKGVWYEKLKYSKRKAVSEVSAIYFSQLVSGYKFHPRIVEFYYSLRESEYTKEELLSYLKERVNDYEIYRFT